MPLNAPKFFKFRLAALRSSHTEARGTPRNFCRISLEILGKPPGKKIWKNIIFYGKSPALSLAISPINHSGFLPNFGRISCICLQFSFKFRLAALQKFQRNSSQNAEPNSRTLLEGGCFNKVQVEHGQKSCPSRLWGGLSEASRGENQRKRKVQFRPPSSANNASFCSRVLFHSHLAKQTSSSKKTAWNQDIRKKKQKKKIKKVTKEKTLQEKTKGHERPFNVVSVLEP